MLSEYNERCRPVRQRPAPAGAGLGYSRHQVVIVSRSVSPIDSLLIAADVALRTLSGANQASRPFPMPLNAAGEPLSDAQRRLSGALMRVNHVGEVCAQALYSAQGLSSRRPDLQRQFDAAAREETDHLAWIQQRLRELDAHTSFLNPLWYAGAFGIGLLAGRAGDAISLGFVVETERQVEKHLDSHLERLPPADLASRAVVRQMKDDEARHAAAAEAAGAAALGDAAGGSRHDHDRALHLKRVWNPSEGRRKVVGSALHGLISKLVVMVAVFASMMLAEQYFSCDMRTARSTTASVSAGPLTTKCMWIFVNTFGSLGARSEVTATWQAFT